EPEQRRDAKDALDDGGETEYLGAGGVRNVDDGLLRDEGEGRAAGDVVEEFAVSELRQPGGEFFVFREIAGAEFVDTDAEGEEREGEAQGPNHRRLWLGGAHASGSTGMLPGSTSALSARE